MRALEVLLALLFNTTDGSEAWICGILQGHDHMQRPSLNLRSRAPQTQVCLDKDRAAEFLLEAWRKGPVVKQIEYLLSRSEVVDESDEGTDLNRDFDSRVAEALAATQAQNQAVNQAFVTECDSGALLSPMNTDTTPGGLPFINPETTPFSNSHEAQPRASSPAASISLPLDFETCARSEIPPPSPILPTHWPYLLDLYFATTHCWFPIAQKHELLRTAYTLASYKTSATDSATIVPEGLSRGDAAFLHAVIAFASRQASMVPTSQRPSGYIHDPAILLNNLTETPLFDEPAHYDLGHVRVLLLLAIDKLDRGLWASAWEATGRAMYTASFLGLLPQDSSTRRTKFRDDDAKRTLMGCAVLETLIAARLNTRPLFRHTGIRSLGFLAIDGLEEWEPWQPKVGLGGSAALSQLGSHQPGHVVSTFNRLIEHVSTLSEILHVQGESTSTELEALETFKRCEQVLNNDLAQPASVDMPPQGLCLRLASVALFEASAAHCMAYSTGSLERPPNYWSDMLSLVELLQERSGKIGWCSIPPVIQIFLELLSRAIERRVQQHGVNGRAAIETKRLQNLLSGCLVDWKSGRSGRGSNNIQLPSGQDQDSVHGSHIFRQQQQTVHLENVTPEGHAPAQLPIPIPSIASDMGMVVGSDSQMVLDEIQVHPPLLPLELEQGGTQSAQPVMETSQIPQPQAVIGPMPEFFTEDLLDDNGLFDSLAALDSADW